MAFPASPNNGDRYTNVHGTTWEYVTATNTWNKVPADALLASDHMEGVYTAAANLGGHRAVVENSAGKIVYADNTTAAHRNAVLGITTASIGVDEEGSVHTYGPITEPSWTWTPQSSIFLTTAGQLSHTRPLSGFVCKLGFALSISTMFVDIQLSIVLI